MKKVLIVITGVILYASQFMSEAHADERPGIELRQNVRILLEITEGEKPVTTFSIVGSEGDLRLDNIANMVQINDAQVPSILSLRINLNPQGQFYRINYSYGLQMPVITGTTMSKDGKTSSHYEYKSLSVSGLVNMKVGDKLEILKDPKRSVVLKLELADSINE